MKMARIQRDQFPLPGPGGFDPEPSGQGIKELVMSLFKRSSGTSESEGHYSGPWGGIQRDQFPLDMTIGEFDPEPSGHGILGRVLNYLRGQPAGQEHSGDYSVVSPGGRFGEFSIGDEDRIKY